MKTNYNRTMPPNLLLVVMIGLTLVGCAANSSNSDNANLQANQPTKPATSFLNRVWKVNKSNSVASGQLYTFLSEGTLVIASEHGKPAFGSWTYKDGSLTMIEEGVSSKADILKLSQHEFHIRMNNPGQAVEIEFVPATGSGGTE